MRKESYIDPLRLKRAELFSELFLTANVSSFENETRHITLSWCDRFLVNVARGCSSMRRSEIHRVAIVGWGLGVHLSHGVAIVGWGRGVHLFSWRCLWIGVACGLALLVDWRCLWIFDVVRGCSTSCCWPRSSATWCSRSSTVWRNARIRRHPSRSRRWCVPYSAAHAHSSRPSSLSALQELVLIISACEIVSGTLAIMVYRNRCY